MWKSDPKPEMWWRRMLGQAANPSNTAAETADPSEAQPAAAPPRRWIDEAGLQEQLGGDKELLTELTRLFDMEREKRLQALREAVATKDGRAVKFAAHAIKSGLTNFAAMDAVHLAGGIEQTGRAAMEGDATALNGLEDRVDALETCMQEMVDQLCEMTGITI